MIDGILEIAMLLCFAAAWPVNILRSWRARTAKGASVLFMIILEIGYLFGMANKVANDDVSYVLFFYVFNFALVLVNIAIVMRNRALDAQRQEHRALSEPANIANIPRLLYSQVIVFLPGWKSGWQDFRACSRTLS